MKRKGILALLLCVCLLGCTGNPAPQTPAVSADVSSPAQTAEATITPAPTPEPVAETNETTDPLLYVFAGILALVIAGIVVVAMNNRKTTKRSQKK